MKNQFLYNALTEEKNGKRLESSKRLCGFIGWIVCQICILSITGFELYYSHTISSILNSLIMTDLGSCVVLIGAKTFASVFNKTNERNE